MSSRLALVGCRETTEGPWTIAKGNESKLEIFGLGQGECVVLELETPEGHQTLKFSSIGTHHWPKLKAGRYRVNKQSTDVCLPTTVRILLSQQGVQQ